MCLRAVSAAAWPLQVPLSCSVAKGASAVSKHHVTFARRNNLAAGTAHDGEAARAVEAAQPGKENYFSRPGAQVLPSRLNPVCISPCEI